MVILRSCLKMIWIWFSGINNDFEEDWFSVATSSSYIIIYN